MGHWFLAQLFLNLFIGLSWGEEGYQENPYVRIGEESGVIVEGIYAEASDGTPFHAYLGVPYGSIPGRFQNAKLVDYGSWAGKINATTEPPKCVQINPTTNEAEGVEDCLLCNIFTPAKLNWRKYDVIIWYYGGGFNGGFAGGIEIPKYIMNENIDIILVRCQYRTGELGFMNLGDENMPGNYGVNDICLITKWVNKYIHYFGGNPGSVTVMGESAGGCAAHLVIEVCYPKYVHRAYLGSGSIFVTYPVQKEQVIRATELCAGLVNCTGNNVELYNCLRKVDSKALLEACNSPSILMDPHTNLLKWVPTYDSYPIGNDFLEKGLQAYVPLVAGVCKDEWILSNNIGSCPYVVPLLRSDPETFLYFILGKFDSKLSPEEKTTAVPLLIKFYFNFNVTTASDEDLCTAFAKMAADVNIYFPWMYTLCLHKGAKWANIVLHSTDLNEAFAKSLGVTDQKNPVPHACEAELWGNFRSYYFPNVSAKASIGDYALITRANNALSNFCKNNDPTAGVMDPPLTSHSNCKKLVLKAINEYTDGPASPSLVNRLITVYKLWVKIFSYYPKCE